MRLELALATLLAAFAFPVGAATWNFAFTDASDVLHAEGGFVTGDESGDPGYFLVTDLTFTSVRDEQTGNLNTGTLSGTGFQVGAAYNPVTGAFINHFGALTWPDIGHFNLVGSTAPTDLGGASVFGNSFAQAGGQNNLEIFGDVAGSVVFFVSQRMMLTVASADVVAPVPLPAGGVLIGSALLGLLALRRRT